MYRVMKMISTDFMLIGILFIMFITVALMIRGGLRRFRKRWGRFEDD